MTGAHRGHLLPAGCQTAVLSTDRRYRYLLTRRWAAQGPAATFVMLNPSTADATVDDPTVRRCRDFARRWGMSALHVLNLYALRATDPRELRHTHNPTGPDNDWYLSHYAQQATGQGWPLIAAWGVHATPDRVAHVLALPGMTGLHALGQTKTGAPRHPLYLPASAQPAPWPPSSCGAP